MSAILIYSVDHNGFDYICPGYDSEQEAFKNFIDSENGFKIITEIWDGEQNIENGLIEVKTIVIIKHENKQYNVEFLYIDESIFINPIND